MAVFDWVAVAFAAWVIHSQWLTQLHPMRIFLVLTVIGIVTHFVLKIDTMLGYYLGLNPDPRPNRPIC